MVVRPEFSCRLSRASLLSSRALFFAQLALGSIGGGGHDTSAYELVPLTKALQSLVKPSACGATTAKRLMNCIKPDCGLHGHRGKGQTVSHRQPKLVGLACAACFFHCALGQTGDSALASATQPLSHVCHLIASRALLLCPRSNAAPQQARGRSNSEHCHGILFRKGSRRRIKFTSSSLNSCMPDPQPRLPLVLANPLFGVFLDAFEKTTSTKPEGARLTLVQKECTETVEADSADAMEEVQELSVEELEALEELCRVRLMTTDTAVKVTSALAVS